MKSILFIFAILASVAHAQVAPSASPAECELKSVPHSREILLNFNPSYFAKISYDGKFMTYTNGAPWVMDIQHPEKKIRLPGSYDTVPTQPIGADGDMYISVPTGGLSFFHQQSIAAAMEAGETLYRSGSQDIVGPNLGSYQSVGTFVNEDGKQIVRATTGYSATDYDASVKPWRVINTGSICGNGGGGQLPMISKNGKEIAYYNSTTGTTIIYRINDDRSCTKILDLGFAASKVEFSYDGKRIAFHNYDGGMSVTHSEMGGAANLYLMELDRSEEGKLKVGPISKLTTNIAGERSYYPTFTPEGQIAYIHRFGNGTYAFRIMDPVDVQRKPQGNRMDVCETCTDEQTKRNAAIQALGSLWRQVCTANNSITANEAAYWTLSLDPANCENIVRTKWEEFKQRVLGDTKVFSSGKITQETVDGLSVEDLIVACPTAARIIDETNQVGTTAGSGANPSGSRRLRYANRQSGSRDAEHLFRIHCMGCHDASSSSFGSLLEWNSLTLDQVNNMLIAITSGAMPKDSHLENPGKVLKPLIKELKKRKQQLEASEE